MSQVSKVWNVTQANGGRARCEPGWMWKPAPLPDYDLWYVQSGQGTMKLAGQQYALSKGTCFVVRPGDTPEATQHPEDRLVVMFIHFAPGIDGKGCEIPERHAVVKDTVHFELLLHRLLHVLPSPDKWDRRETDLLMQQLLMLLCRWQQESGTGGHEYERQEQWVRRLAAYIREFPGRRFTLRELADYVQLSPGYVSQLFKKHTGHSLKSFQTDVRLERAMHLLMETPMNVSQVAEALGYNNVYLFSKQFKDRYQAPPSQFRWQAAHARQHRTGGKGKFSP